MKERLDIYLVQNGYFPSREKAKRAIMAGLVYVNGQISDKAGNKIKVDEDELVVRGAKCPYVSRGGLKLAKAMEKFPIDLNKKICMDIGASTGGFTDCMLQNGATKVFAVDVGYGQLDYKLRQDNRVVNMEKCNFRYIEPEDIGDEIDFASCDVSFISLKLIFPAAYPLLKDGGEMVCLVKPQFEAGKEQIGKKGIVRDDKVRIEVLENVIGYAESVGLQPIGLDFSPVTGAKGNVEYLLYLKKNEMDEDKQKIITRENILEIVSSSHNELE